VKRFLQDVRWRSCPSVELKDFANGGRDIGIATWRHIDEIASEITTACGKDCALNTQPPPGACAVA
jgi:hypothetical protein